MRTRRRRHGSSARAVAAWLLACVLLAALLVPGGAWAQEGSAVETGRKVYDAAILRPLGFVQVVVGAALFPVFWLPALVTGDSQAIVEICIDGPFDQVFGRELGDF